MIKYRDPKGNIVEVEGDLFVCLDKNGEEAYAGDDTNAGIIRWGKGSLQWAVTKGEQWTPLWTIVADIELIKERVKD